MDSNPKPPTSPTVAAVAGIVGAQMAVLYFLAIAAPSNGHPSLGQTQLSEAALVASEGLISLVFAVVALLLYVRSRHGSSLVLGAYLAAVSRLAFLGWQFGAHWKPGWHYIMDPADSTASSWSLIIVGVVQVVAFVLAAQWSGPDGDRPETTARDQGAPEKASNHSET